MFSRRDAALLLTSTRVVSAEILHDALRSCQRFWPSPELVLDERDERHWMPCRRLSEDAQVDDLLAYQRSLHARSRPQGQAAYAIGDVSHMLATAVVPLFVGFRMVSSLSLSALRIGFDTRSIKHRDASAIERLWRIRFGLEDLETDDGGLADKLGIEGNPRPRRRPSAEHRDVACTARAGPASQVRPVAQRALASRHRLLLPAFSGCRPTVWPCGKGESGCDAGSESARLAAGKPADALFRHRDLLQREAWADSCQRCLPRAWRLLPLLYRRGRPSLRDLRSQDPAERDAKLRQYLRGAVGAGTDGCRHRQSNRRQK